MGALCPTGKNEVIQTNNNRVPITRKESERDSNENVQIPSSSKEKVDEEISSKDKALKELRQKQYQDVVNKFSMETLDVSKQISGYDYSEEDF